MKNKEIERNLPALIGYVKSSVDQSGSEPTHCHNLHSVSATHDILEYTGSAITLFNRGVPTISCTDFTSSPGGDSSIQIAWVAAEHSKIVSTKNSPQGNGGPCTNTKRTCTLRQPIAYKGFVTCFLWMAAIQPGQVVH